MAAKEKRVHHSYRKGGRPKSDEPPTRDAKAPAPNKSWEPGRKGQGGEGFSEGTAAAAEKAPGRRD